MHCFCFAFNCVFDFTDEYWYFWFVECVSINLTRQYDQNKVKNQGKHVIIVIKVYFLHI